MFESLLLKKFYKGYRALHKPTGGGQERVTINKVTCLLDVIPPLEKL